MKGSAASFSRCSISGQARGLCEGEQVVRAAGPARSCSPRGGGGGGGAAMSQAALRQLRDFDTRQPGSLKFLRRSLKNVHRLRQTWMLHRGSYHAAVRHHTALVFVSVCSCSCGDRSKLSAALHRGARPLRQSIPTHLRRRRPHRPRVTVQLSDAGRSTPSGLPDSRDTGTEVLSLACRRRESTLHESH